MTTNRLEAFSDGVLAIIITIMVLEMKIPEGSDLESLRPILPVFLTYLGSFVYLGIYWSNHHHLMHAVSKVNGKVLWANLNLLFWLSLFPFVTGWMGENNFKKIPVILYGTILLMAALSYRLLTQVAINSEGSNSIIRKAIVKDRKGILSIFIYIAALAISFFQPAISVFLYLLVALIWFVPDSRIEKVI